MANNIAQIYGVEVNVVYPSSEGSEREYIEIDQDGDVVALSPEHLPALIEALLKAQKHIVQADRRSPR